MKTSKTKDRYPLSSTPYQFKAGVDFSHCERGWCRHCSSQQQRHCEKEAAAILNKFPPSDQEEEKCRIDL